MLQSVTYSEKRVPAHGNSCARVVLINEAPGPDEDKSGIPCFGQQGGNIYRTLCLVGVDWAKEISTFSWPVKNPEGRTKKYRTRCEKRTEFLARRAEHLLITNAYPYWPKPSNAAKNFCSPKDEDVLSPKNLSRLEEDMRGERPILLICGAMAYLACTGTPLKRSSQCENKQLSDNTLEKVNERLKTSFSAGWYLGHTRRWNLHQDETNRALECIAASADWSRTSR